MSGVANRLTVQPRTDGYDAAPSHSVSEPSSEAMIVRTGAATQPMELTMRRILAATVFLGLTYGAYGADDVTFIQSAIGINLAEIAAGELAESKGESPQVKEFGAMLVEDHTKGKADAVALAGKMSVQIPGAPSVEAQAAYQKLSSLTGAAFDHAFAAEMVGGHEKAIAFFTEQTNSGDAAIAAYAKETLPTLQKHLEMARSLPQ